MTKQGAFNYSEPGKQLPIVIIIAGPTGVGKTALAIRLAQYFNTAIISADSRQCYREMTIGTAKPTPTELAVVKHYFINSHAVVDKLTAYDFEQYALTTLKTIFKNHKTAIVCGGTGLYIQALCEGLDEMPEADEKITHETENHFLKKGIKWLQETLAKEDPLFYKEAEKQNPARLIRALSFYRSTGQSITKFKNNSKKDRPFNVLKVALELPRPELYERINLRVDKMMEAGLLDEVKKLLPFQQLKSLNTVGYKELFSYLKAECSLAEAVNKIKQHSRNYAKRQLTWFRKDQEYQWFQPDGENLILSFLKEKIKSFTAKPD